MYDDPLAAPLWSIAFAHRANAVLSERRPDEKVRRGSQNAEKVERRFSHLITSASSSIFGTLLVARPPGRSRAAVMSYGASHCPRFPSRLCRTSHACLRALADSHLRSRLVPSNAGAGYVGNAADAAKIRRLEEQRAKQAADVERAKEKLAADADKSHIVAFASSKSEAIDAAASAASVGLQTKAQFAEKRAAAAAELEAEARAKAEAAAAEKSKEKDRKRKKQKKDAKSKLSFADDEEEFGGEEEEDDDAARAADGKKTKFASVGKNPAVDTAFLPDRDRERAETEERERLKREYVERANRVKAEKLEITFSYWDGGGHRRRVEVLKGDTIGAFLQKARDALSSEFRELRHASADGLMYIKEDLIMPHSVSFHDLIVNKARGKSGPLFHFDVHDDVRVMGGGAGVEKDESHAGKVIHRTWYEKNKHIFPASRWELWEPGKEYGGYTIHGGEVR